MKRAPIIMFILVFLAGLCLAAAPESNPLSLPVKQLHAAPDADSSLIYKIPIDVEILDISADTNWYKVKIAFRLGPLGYTYVGWAKVPVGEVLSMRSQKLAKTPVTENPLP